MRGGFTPFFISLKLRVSPRLLLIREMNEKIVFDFPRELTFIVLIFYDGNRIFRETK